MLFSKYSRKTDLCCRKFQKQNTIKAAKRQSKSSQERQVRQQWDAKAKASKRQLESTEERQARQRRDAKAKASKHQLESTEERQARQQQDAKAKAFKRQFQSSQQQMKSNNILKVSHAFMLLQLKGLIMYVSVVID